MSPINHNNLEGEEGQCTILHKLKREQHSLDEKVFCNEEVIRFLEKQEKTLKSLWMKTKERLSMCKHPLMKQNVLNNTNQYLQMLQERFMNEDCIYFSSYGKYIQDKIQNDITKYQNMIRDEYNYMNIDQNIQEDSHFTLLNDQNTYDIYTDQNSKSMSEFDYKWVKHQLSDDQNLQKKFVQMYINSSDIHNNSTDIHNNSTENEDSLSEINSVDIINANEQNYLNENDKNDEEVLEKLKLYYNTRYGEKYKQLKHKTNFENNHFQRWFEKQKEKPNKKFLKEVDTEFQLREYYKKKYGDKFKRKKDLTLFDSVHFKKWYKKSINKPDKYLKKEIDGGSKNIIEKKHLQIALKNSKGNIFGVNNLNNNSIGKRKRHLRTNLEKTLKTLTRDPIDNIYDLLYNFEIEDTIKRNIQISINDQTGNLDQFLQYLNRILSEYVDTINRNINEEIEMMYSGFGQEDMVIEENMNMSIPSSSSSPPSPFSFPSPLMKPIQSGGANTHGFTETELAIRLKIYNDLFHDFNGTRDNKGSSETRDANRRFINVLSNDKTGLIYTGDTGEFYHLNEDEYIKKILKEKSFDELQNFVVQTKHDSKTNKLINALNEKPPGKIILEDMPISKTFKDKVGFVSQHTYTNILDPITSIKIEDGTTSKTDDLYDYTHLNRIETPQNRIANILTIFFKTIFKNVYNITVSHLFDSNETGTDQLDPKYPNFRVLIQFTNNMPNTLIINLYGGMFTVKRINDFIWAIHRNPTLDMNKFENFLIKNLDIFRDNLRETKIMKALRMFYIKLRELGRYTHDQAILFIQMMKTFGDHGQINEFNSLLNKNEDTGMIRTDNIYFASKDKIVIAEALRLNCPAVFELQSLKTKIPLESADIILPDIDIEYNTDKVFFYYTAGLSGDLPINIGKILLDNNIIDRNAIDNALLEILENNFTYEKDATSGFYNLTSPIQLSIDLNIILTSTKKTQYSSIINKFFDNFTLKTSFDENQLKNIVKDLLKYIATEKQLENIFNNTNFVSQTKKSIKDLFNTFSKYNTIYLTLISNFERDVKSRSPDRRLATINIEIQKLLLQLRSLVTPVLNILEGNLPVDFQVILNSTDASDTFVHHIRSRFNKINVNVKNKFINESFLKSEVNTAIQSTETLQKKITSIIQPKQQRGQR